MVGQPQPSHGASAEIPAIQNDHIAALAIAGVEHPDQPTIVLTLTLGPRDKEGFPHEATGGSAPQLGLMTFGIEL
jgi:hypothetical protein